MPGVEPRWFLALRSALCFPVAPARFPRRRGEDRHPTFVTSRGHVFCPLLFFRQQTDTATLSLSRGALQAVQFTAISVV